MFTKGDSVWFIASDSHPEMYGNYTMIHVKPKHRSVYNRCGNSPCLPACMPAVKAPSFRNVSIHVSMQVDLLCYLLLPSRSTCNCNAIAVASQLKVFKMYMRMFCFKMEILSRDFLKSSSKSKFRFVNFGNFSKNFDLTTDNGRAGCCFRISSLNKNRTSNENSPKQREEIELPIKLSLL